jgi:LPS sulfotransferase NodH
VYDIVLRGVGIAAMNGAGVYLSGESVTVRAAFRQLKRLAVVGVSPAVADGVARTVLRARSLHGGSDYTRFVVLGIARTGSTLLVNLLNGHSQVMAFGELFRSPDAIGWDVRPFTHYQRSGLLALYRSDPVAFLEQEVFRRWPRRYAAVGFKLFYYHAKEPPYSQLWDYLARDRSIRILHIKRRNILEQYLSLQIANLTNIWSTQSRPRCELPPIRLEAEACHKHFAWVRELEREAAEFFRAHHVHNVYYEDLAADRRSQMRAVHGFLDIEDEAAEPTLVRQRNRPLSQSIANFDELRREFAETRWADFFHNQPADV